ncbi:MAG: superoxide dismutase [Candidatus Magasanikbacteria bacterium]|nr:superoxide dismutase [Candidatus Magasanikbacteria bacterium]
MYEAKNFDYLLGLPGFSDQLMKNHFTLYQGYVMNANKVNSLLDAMLKNDTVGTPEYAELTRRFGWEFNGMRLHEYYFEAMTKEAAPAGLDAHSTLAQKIATEFGSLELWEKDFKAVAAMRGIGWAILAYDAAGDRLFNVWINEHDVGHLAGAKPILVMDVFEHAYMLDYGVKRADYISAYWKIIDWNVVQNRF